jgi:hypothetical protein
MTVVHFILHAGAGIIGIVCLFLAFFLHEDEEGNLRNRLEELWIRTDDLQTRFLSRQAAFLRTSSQIALNMIDRVFGVSLISARRIRALVILSIASSLLSFPLLAIVDDVRNVGFKFGSYMFGWGMFGLGLSGLLLGLLGLLPGFTSSKVADRVATFVAISVVAAAVIFGYFAKMSLWETPLILICGGLIDILFIHFLRWVLARIIDSDSAIRMGIGLIATLAAGLVLNYPFFLFSDEVAGLAIGEAMSGAFGDPVAHETFMEKHVMDAALIFATNTFDAACSFLIVGTIGICLAHRLFWPLLSRPLYAVQRRGVLTNSKLLSAIGISGLLYAVPSRMTLVSGAIQSVAKLLR